MKPRTFFLPPAFLACILALTLASGCSHFPGRQSSPDAYRPVGGKSLNLLQLRDTVKATRLALNRTDDALNRIPGSPAPREAYEAFATALNDFQKLAEQTLKQSADVRSRGRELFAEWNAETDSISDPQIRKTAEDRRLTLQDSYDSMINPLNTARTDLARVQSDLSDIQKALALDLTPAGIDAIKPSIDRINRSSETSVKSLDAFATQLDRIADALPMALVGQPTK